MKNEERVVVVAVVVVCVFLVVVVCGLETVDVEVSSFQVIVLKY